MAAALFLKDFCASVGPLIAIFLDFDPRNGSTSNWKLWQQALLTLQTASTAPFGAASQYHFKHQQFGCQAFETTPSPIGTLNYSSGVRQGYLHLVAHQAEVVLLSGNQVQQEMLEKEIACLRLLFQQQKQPSPSPTPSRSNSGYLESLFTNLSLKTKRPTLTRSCSVASEKLNIYALFHICLVVWLSRC